MTSRPSTPNSSSIATEDTTYLLEGLGIDTGVDRTVVGRASARLESFLEKEFPGKLHRLPRRTGAPEAGASSE